MPEIRNFYTLDRFEKDTPAQSRQVEAGQVDNHSDGQQRERDLTHSLEQFREVYLMESQVEHHEADYQAYQD